jgi:hypothetical protein
MASLMYSPPPDAIFDYATLAEVKGHLPLGTPATDPILSDLITRVSRFIDRYKRVPHSFFNNGGLYAEHWPLYFDGNGLDRLWISPCTAVVSVLVDGMAVVENTDFITYPYNSTPKWRLDMMPNGGTWTQWQKNIEIDAYWGGYTDTPEDINEACIILVARLLQGGQQMFADQSAINELGQVMMTDPLSAQARALLDAMPGMMHIG